LTGVKPRQQPLRGFAKYFKQIVVKSDITGPTVQSNIRIFEKLRQLAHMFERTSQRRWLGSGICMEKVTLHSPRELHYSVMRLAREVQQCQHDISISFDNVEGLWGDEWVEAITSQYRATTLAFLLLQRQPKRRAKFLSSNPSHESDAAHEPHAEVVNRAV
jgi:hypothetical protein